MTRPARAKPSEARCLELNPVQAPSRLLRIESTSGNWSRLWELDPTLRVLQIGLAFWELDSPFAIWTRLLRFGPAFCEFCKLDSPFRNGIGPPVHHSKRETPPTFHLSL